MLANNFGDTNTDDSTAGMALWDSRPHARRHLEAPREVKSSRAALAASRDPSGREARLWRMVLVGSAGVGKSVVLVLFCAYVAVHHGYDILLLARPTKYGSASDAAVRFSGCHVIKYTGCARTTCWQRRGGIASRMNIQHNLACS